MTPILTLRHERIDDIPLILRLAQHIHLEEVLERHLGTRGLQQGWSNGVHPVVSGSPPLGRARLGQQPAADLGPVWRLPSP
jgi:hypothetical protein